MSLATLFQDVEDCFRRPAGLRFTETEAAYELQALVAGVKAKEIQISCEKGSLSIEAKGGGYSYSYLVPLPQGEIDEKAIPEAIAEEGILKITIPKAKTAQPLRIAVKSS